MVQFHRGMCISDHDNGYCAGDCCCADSEEEDEYVEPVAGAAIAQDAFGGPGSRAEKSPMIAKLKQRVFVNISVDDAGGVAPEPLAVADRCQPVVYLIVVYVVVS